MEILYFVLKFYRSLFLGVQLTNKTTIGLGNKPLSEPMLTRFTDSYKRGGGQLFKFKFKFKLFIGITSKATSFSNVQKTWNMK